MKTTNIKNLHEMVAEQQPRIEKAKAQLVLNHPFFGTLCLGMGFKWDASVGTAAVDYDNIYVSPAFAASLSDSELMFVLAHECMHPALGHNSRRGARDRFKWNVACDVVINQHLEEQGVGKRPALGVFEPEMFAEADGFSERVYTLLPEDLEGDEPGDEPGDDGDEPGDDVDDGDEPGKPSRRKGDQNDDEGKGGKRLKPMDDCRDAKTDPASRAEQEAKWKVKVAQAAVAAKMMGKLSGGLARLVGQLIEPQVSWRDQLANFMVKCADDCRSWSRFARRWLPQGVFAPARSGETMPPIVVAIDTSGSVGEAELRTFVSELNGITSQCCPAKTTVVYFDSCVAGVDEFDKGEPVTLNPRGGGGTDFAPVMDYVATNCDDAACVVVLTDLCCDSFGVSPQCPVLWCAVRSRGYEPSTNVPFGEVLTIDTKGE